MGAAAAVGAALFDAAATLALAADFDLPLPPGRSEQPDAGSIKTPASATAANSGSNRKVSWTIVERIAMGQATPNKNGWTLEEARNCCIVSNASTKTGTALIDKLACRTCRSFQLFTGSQRLQDTVDLREHLRIFSRHNMNDHLV